MAAATNVVDFPASFLRREVKLGLSLNHISPFSSIVYWCSFLPLYMKINKSILVWEVYVDFYFNFKID